MNCAVVSFCRGEKGEGSLDDTFLSIFSIHWRKFPRAPSPPEIYEISKRRHGALSIRIEFIRPQYYKRFYRYFQYYTIFASPEYDIVYYSISYGNL